jgi:SNF2 family DNA or RNA helicase
VKNSSAKRPNAYRREVPHASHKRIWALTGTPAPNSLLDLFAQVRFVDGGQRLGRAFDLFKQTYFKPSGFQGYQWKELPGSKEAIEQRIHDITLTLRSKDWLDIPDTVVEDVDIHLPPKLIADYKAFEKELVLQIRKDKEITATNAAALVSKLLQFTSGSLYDEEKKWHDIHELKLDALAKIAKETKSPLLVAYAFQHESHRIRARFPQARFFADAKNAASQTQLLADWNDKKIPMLVAHPKSVGHGLNLQHGGNTLIWMSLTYSREDYEQMIARLSRRGQDALVNVYRLMVPDTVDYAVATVIEDKRATEDRLLTALQLLESCREVPLKTRIDIVNRPLDPESDWFNEHSAYLEGEWI